MNQVTEEHVFDTFNTQMRASLIVRQDDFKPFVIRADGVDYNITSWE